MCFSFDNYYHIIFDIDNLTYKLYSLSVCILSHHVGGFAPASDKSPVKTATNKSNIV